MTSIHTPFIRIGTLALLALSCAACGTLTQRAESVTLTASPHEVEGCELIGPVNVGTFDTEFDQRQREMRYETARKGGNVLKVHSYARSNGGQAYRCEQPLHPDRVAS